MEVGFTGSRGYPRPDLVENFVRVVARKYPDATIVSGGRGAVDETAEEWGKKCGLTVVSYRPRDKDIQVVKTLPDGTETSYLVLAWDSFVRNCFLRNTSIAMSDRVIGFWDLRSRGTADCISKARGKQREVFVYGPDGAQLTSLQVANQLKEVLG